VVHAYETPAPKKGGKWEDIPGAQEATGVLPDREKPNTAWTQELKNHAKGGKKMIRDQPSRGRKKRDFSSTTRLSKKNREKKKSPSREPEARIAWQKNCF